MKRELGFVASLIGLALLGAGQQVERRPVGIDVPITFKVKAGPLLEATREIERQTGLSFSVLPELLPKDVRIPDLDYRGPAGAGLDRLAEAAKLKWEVGVFGGIVLLPRKFKEPLEADWILDSFEQAGSRIVKIAPRDLKKSWASLPE